MPVAAKLPFTAAALAGLGAATWRVALSYEEKAFLLRLLRLT
jgi:hypothetical protein